MARRRPKHVDVDKPQGYGKRKLRRWERRRTKQPVRPADQEGA
jgi:hypothetical protein